MVNNVKDFLHERAEGNGVTFETQSLTMMTLHRSQLQRNDPPTQNELNKRNAKMIVNLSINVAFAVTTNSKFLPNKPPSSYYGDPDHASYPWIRDWEKKGTELTELSDPNPVEIAGIALGRAYRHNLRLIFEHIVNKLPNNMKTYMWREVRRMNSNVRKQLSICWTSAWMASMKERLGQIIKHGISTDWVTFQNKKSFFANEVVVFMIFVHGSITRKIPEQRAKIQEIFKGPAGAMVRKVATETGLKDYDYPVNTDVSNPDVYRFNVYSEGLLELQRQENKQYLASYFKNMKETVRSMEKNGWIYMKHRNIPRLWVDAVNRVTTQPLMQIQGLQKIIEGSTVPKGNTTSTDSNKGKSKVAEVEQVPIAQANGAPAADANSKAGVELEAQNESAVEVNAIEKPDDKHSASGNGNSGDVMMKDAGPLPDIVKGGPLV